MHVRCPQCGCSLNVPDKHAGRKGRCPKSNCGKVFILNAVSDKKISSKVQKKQRVKKRQSVPPDLPDNDDWLNDLAGLDDFSLETNAKTESRPQKKSVSLGTPRSKKQKPKSNPKKKSSSKKMMIFGVVSIVAMTVLVLMVTGILSTGSGSGSNQLQAAPMGEYEKKIIPYFKKYCFDCHNNDSQEADLNLEQYTTGDSILKNRKRWERVYDMIRVGAMPPSDYDRPGDDEQKAVAEWLEKKLFFVDCDLTHDPGRVTIRRLNRNEYNNTTRDLLGVDLKLANSFPLDDTGYGFDNIGDVLTISSLLMERYLDAAETLSHAAIFNSVDSKYLFEHYASDMKAEGSIGKSDNNGRMTFSSVGVLSKQIAIPETGTYEIKIKASADQAGNEPAKMALKLNGKMIHLFEIPEHQKEKTYEYLLAVEGGKQTFEIGFVNDFYDPKAKNKNRRDRNLHVRSIKIEGPIRSFKSQSTLRDQVLASMPKGKSDEEIKKSARKFIEPFLRRAFRRKVQTEEIQKYVDLAAMVYQREQNYERAIQIAVQGILVSPQFLFRIEDSTRPDDSPEKRHLNDFELASRLSYFLWNSMPDDELLDLADSNKLHEVDTLKKQVQRMLKDQRSNSLSKNFAGQWLGLRLLNEVSPDKEIFKDYNDDLKKAMWTETEMVFDDILRNDRNILDFLDARYTFLNERLAKHYGIKKDVKGNHFRKVDLTGTNRAGIITHASILTITSYPTRTSPVKRGEWILENLLDKPPPAAPPVVPAFEETAAANPGLSFRSQLEIHRKDPTCASCHKVMDQLGFGLENYDGIGRWRDMHENLTVDPSGELPGGIKFHGPIELGKILRQNKTDFARCITKKMMIYALGRGIDYYDRCAVDKITSHLAKNDYRMSQVIMGIVLSEPFLMSRGETPINSTNTDTESKSEEKQ